MLSFLHYKTVSISYDGCETWFVTQMEEYKLRTFEKGRWREYLDLRGADNGDLARTV
jgi:hypothetical protein